LNKQITLIGYYGFQNAGDEWLLHKSIQFIKAHFPLKIIHILYNTPDIAPNYLSDPAIQMINRWSIKDIIKSFSVSEYIIFGGGGLFQDSTSARSFYYYLFLLFLAVIFKKQILFWGQGIGPIHRFWLKTLFKILIKKVAYISVRDQYSYDVMINWNYPKNHLALTSDLAFLYETPSLNLKPAWSPKARIGISFRSSAIPKKSLLILNQFFESFPKEQCIFLEMHTPNDTQAIQHLMSAQFNTTINMNHHILSHEQLPYPISLIIGCRFHALVYASLHNIPFLALVYDEKVKSLAITLGQEYIDLRQENISLEQIQKKYMLIVKNFLIYQEKLIKQTQVLIQKATLLEPEAVFKD